MHLGIELVRSSGRSTRFFRGVVPLLKGSMRPTFEARAFSSERGIKLARQLSWGEWAAHVRGLSEFETAPLDMLQSLVDVGFAGCASRRR